MNKYIHDDELLVQFGKKQIGPLKKHLGPCDAELLRVKNYLSIIMRRTGAGGGEVEARKLFTESTATSDNEDSGMGRDHSRAQNNKALNHRELLERLLKSKDRKQQDELLKTLEDSPVALSLAYFYIKSASGKTGQGMRIDQYLKLYRKKEIDLKIDNDSKNRVILVALKLSLDAIKKDKEIGLEAEKICLLLAYLAPHRLIPMCMLTGVLPNETPKIMKALKLLAAYGIVSSKLQDQVVRRNRSIQEIIRANFKYLEEATLEKGLQLIANQDLKAEEVYHAMALWDHASNYEVLVKKYHGLIEKMIDALYIYIRDNELLVQFGEKQFGPLEKYLGPHHEEFLRLKQNLAHTIWKTGAGGGRVEARKLYKEIKAIWENNDFNMERDDSQAQYNVVKDHNSDEKHSGAPKFSQEILDKYRNVFDQLVGLRVSGNMALKGYKEADGAPWRGHYVEKLRKIVRDMEYKYELFPYSDLEKKVHKQSDSFMKEASEILMKERFSFINEYEDDKLQELRKHSYYFL